MLIEKARLFLQGEDFGQQRATLRLRQADNVLRHQLVDKNRHAAGLVMRAKDRVDGAPQLRRVVAVLGLDHGPELIGIARFAPVQQGSQPVRHRLIDLVLVAEDRIAAGRRDLDGIERCRLMRIAVIAGVGMKHHFAVGQGADRLAVFLDVGNKHHRAVAFRHGVSAQCVGPHIIADRAKCLGKADLVLVGQVLSAEKDHQMVEPGLIYRCRIRGTQALFEIDTGNLCGQRIGEGGDRYRHNIWYFPLVGSCARFLCSVPADEIRTGTRNQSKRQSVFAPGWALGCAFS